MTAYELDDLDRAILRLLEDDGRRAFRDIARTVGSSEATVRSRVKRLQDHNILRIVAFVDPEELGETHLALLLVKVEPVRHEAAVEAMVALDEVSYVSTLLGRSDLCVEVSTTGNQELWTFLREKVMVIEGVRDVETLSILKVHKLRYTSPAVG